MFDVEEVLKPKTAKTNFLTMRLQSQDEDRLPFLAKVHKSFFFEDVPTPHWKELKGSQQFCWGYAITTHKSQGSQWSSTFIMDESWCFREDRWKWAYTAVTRASEKITLVVN
jgi:exodeoxyribonuclease-5